MVIEVNNPCERFVTRCSTTALNIRFLFVFLVRVFRTRTTQSEAVWKGG